MPMVAVGICGAEVTVTSYSHPRFCPYAALIQTNVLSLMTSRLLFKCPL